MSRNLRVYKQSELASRDTTSPHFLYEINSVGSRPGDGRAGGDGGSSRPKNLFSALWASVCVKIGEGGGWAPRAPPLDPPLINTYGL